jgi:histidinol dehydrogenase
LPQHRAIVFSISPSEDAQSILLCPDADFIAQVEASIAKLLPTMNRKTIIAQRFTGISTHKDCASVLNIIKHGFWVFNRKF